MYVSEPIPLKAYLSLRMWSYWWFIFLFTSGVQGSNKRPFFSAAKRGNEDHKLNTYQRLHTFIFLLNYWEKNFEVYVFFLYDLVLFSSFFLKKGFVILFVILFCKNLRVKLKLLEHVALTFGSVLRDRESSERKKKKHVCINNNQNT